MEGWKGGRVERWMGRMRDGERDSGSGLKPGRGTTAANHARVAQSAVVVAHLRAFTPLRLAPRRSPFAARLWPQSPPTAPPRSLPSAVMSSAPATRRALTAADLEMHRAACKRLVIRSSGGELQARNVDTCPTMRRLRSRAHSGVEPAAERAPTRPQSMQGRRRARGDRAAGMAHLAPCLLLDRSLATTFSPKPGRRNIIVLRWNPLLVLFNVRPALAASHCPQWFGQLTLNCRVAAPGRAGQADHWTFRIIRASELYDLPQYRRSWCRLSYPTASQASRPIGMVVAMGCEVLGAPPRHTSVRVSIDRLHTVSFSSAFGHTMDSHSIDHAGICRRLGVTRSIIHRFSVSYLRRCALL
ncbi:hypothetical protein ANO11243_002360 [Dothideomycetidae sp. 11243]|nr:hypothetical protein ANO11243_002360 [fungal sp. No.11243]